MGSPQRLARQTTAEAALASLTQIETSTGAGATEATLQAIQILLGSPAQAGEAAAATALLATEATAQTLALDATVQTLATEVTTAAVKTVLDGWTAGLTKKDSSNRIQMTGRDYLYAVMEGDIPGHELVVLHGHHDALGTAERLLSNNGTSQTAPPEMTVDAPFVIKGFNNADAAAWAGLRTFLLVAYKADGTKVSEVITMNGLTAVTSTITGLYPVPDESVPLTYGSEGKNAGAIRVYASNGTTELMTMDQGARGFHTGYLYVPTGKTFYMVEGSMGTATNAATVRLYEGLSAPKRIAGPFRGTNRTARSMRKCIGPCVVWLAGTGTAASTALDAEIIGWIE